MGEAYVALEIGEAVPLESGAVAQAQCVPLSMALLCGVRAVDLLGHMEREAADTLAAVGPLGNEVSLGELTLRRGAHDLATGASQDLHVFRVLARELTVAMRVVGVVGLSSGQVEVHVLTGHRFDPEVAGCKTRVLLLADDHCRPLSPSPRLGGGSVEASRGKAAEALVSWTHAAGDTLLARFRNAGIEPRCFPIAEAAADIAEEPKILPVSMLHGCPCCGQPLLLDASTVAGRLRTHGVPNDVLSWAIRMDVARGLSGESRKEVGVRRSEEYKEYAVMTVEELKEKSFGQDVERAAGAALRVARDEAGGLDRPGIKAREPVALARLGSAVKACVRAAGTLSAAAGGLRHALAAYRQGVLRVDGGLPLDAGRFAQHKNLVPRALFEAVTSLAERGVTLQARDGAPPGADQPGPYESAKEVAPDLLLSAVVDMSRGFGLMLDREGGSHALEGAWWSAYGAVPKTDPEGTKSGVRPINDLRPQNAHISASCAGDAGTGREAPPQRCPSIVDLMRLVVRLALDNPGVDILVFKKDLESAFKLLHLNIADAPWQVSELPTEGVPGLGNCRPVAASMVGCFGGSWWPGFFGVLAWSVVAAQLNRGCAEPELNGSGAFQGTTWVDDFGGVVARLGMAPQIATDSYSGLARDFAGNGAINEPKDRREGEPDTRAVMWGFGLDTSRVRNEGYAGGRVNIPEAKWVKLRNLVTGPAFEHVGRRRVKLEDHVSLAHLVAWMGSADSWLNKLVGHLFDLCTSSSAVYVSPPGTQEGVSRMWEGYAEVLISLAVRCDDVGRAGAGTTSPLLNVLTADEQEALGRERDLIGSDSTNTGDEVDSEGWPLSGVMAAASYYDGVYAVQDLEPYMDRLRVLLQDPDQDTLVAIAELLPVVALAMEFGHRWRGRWKTALIDNWVACRAICKMASRNRFLRFLAHMLVRAGAMHGFDTDALYINTKRNELMDDLSRLHRVKTAAELQVHVDGIHPGLKRVDLTCLFDFLLREGSSGVLRPLLLPTESARASLAVQLVERHAAAQRHWELETRKGAPAGRGPKGVAVELFAGLGQFAWCAAGLGLQVGALVDPDARAGAEGRRRLLARSPGCVHARKVDELAELAGADTVVAVFVGAMPVGHGGLRAGSAAIAEVRRAAQLFRRPWWWWRSGLSRSAAAGARAWRTSTPRCEPRAWCATCRSGGRPRSSVWASRSRTRQSSTRHNTGCAPPCTTSTASCSRHWGCCRRCRQAQGHRRD